MQKLLQEIRDRLAGKAYVNEAAITHGIICPILNAIGWNSADPMQLVPEYPVPAGRVDIALLGPGQKPVVFIEAKGLGRAAMGDRQLFEYAFHRGVPMCVLTDGRDWSIYLPAAPGGYDDRRVYRLQLDDRDPETSEIMLRRYLSRDRVRSGEAYDDAIKDHRTATAQRDSVAAIPQAWSELVSQEDDLLAELLTERVEMLSGYRPEIKPIMQFLGGLTPSVSEAAVLPDTALPTASQKTARPGKAAKVVAYRIFGEKRSAPNASIALVEILESIVATDFSKLAELSDALVTPTRRHVARTVEEIYPGRPDHARAAQIAPGWLVGKNLSNHDKMAVLRTACDIYGLNMPTDLEISMPNVR